MSIFKLLNGTSHFCYEHAGDDGAAGGGAAGGDNGGDKGQSMFDTDAIKKEGGQGNDGGQQDPNASAQDDPNKKPDDQKPADKPGQEMARPDWLKDDKFWDDEKGQIRSEEMHKSFKELEKKFHAGDHKAPEKPEDYKLAMNDEQKKVLFGKSDVEAEAIANDPGIKALTTWGAKHKVSQDAINELLGEYVGFVQPELEKVQIDIEAEKAALGKNADAVIKNQMDFFGHLYRSGHINDKHLEELRILGETAAGIQAIQKIREYYGEQPIPTNLNTSGEGLPSKEELSSMLNDPKYGEDKEYTAKVDAAYAKRYGNAPAMSSAQNR